ncbi:DUF6328 family protein [Brachybacterium phenoliresistens]|uniref:DUF6328 family protein n=1 Tax=Brachybacterium phenoliresistens TaxID=396014 RepID=UPI0004ADD29F|nr:DUF6328 family protein [Brachybacterium phenoliresistens]
MNADPKDSSPQDPPLSEADGPTDYARHETRAAQLDRNWNEILQEIRVLQTGSQIVAAFLIVLPFQSRFEILDAFQVGWYLGLLVLALLIVALLLAPVSMHRSLFRRRVKDDIVTASNRIVKLALVMLGLLLAGVVLLIFDVVVGRGAGIAAGAVLLTIVLCLQVVYPRVMVARS